MLGLEAAQAPQKKERLRRERLDLEREAEEFFIRDKKRCRERVEELERAKLQLSSKGDRGGGDTDRFKRHGFGQGEFGMKSRDGSLDRERQEGKPRDAGR